MSPLRGIALKLTSVVLFTVMASLIKASSAHVPTGEAVFFRSFFAMPVIVVWLAMRGDLSTGLKAKRPGLHVLRGLVGVTAMGCGFAALGLLPLPEVTAIGFAAPMMTVLLAAILLGERLRFFRLSAVILGLVGVTIVLWPRLTLDDVGGSAMLGVTLVLVSAVMRAMAQIQIRRMVATEETSAIVFYFSLTATGFSLLTLPFGWVIPEASVLLMLVGAGLIGGVAQIFLTSAYRFAGAAVVAPFDYASILFAILFGYFFFDEAPSAMVLIGSAIVIAAGGIIIWRERQLGMQRGKARPNMTPQG
ncbi:DMT family transporter [Mameliella sediminis]|uniref:DMT family transporter n=1 Tax=Mameliella sediminis TaxID=2836866 RepID=UPI001C4565BA|nr:DMT family transporter [Mameliella sediminis]MBY6114242.1 DMT family transporter [Antarctobacter heliothermus]MBY6142410.1 DMT family transporter [Mameliella alba]MBV7395539.1 DMT family transporter [Mameliella sediminis]MBY6159238.1 DMT family transporter [Mameliella alba]MBY6167709.1 DMT family transporter [Mameliella alba]